MHHKLAALVLSLVLVSCAAEGRLTLEQRYRKFEQLHQRSPEFAMEFAPGPTSLQLFDCSQAEFGALVGAKLTISRIGDGATDETRRAQTVSSSEKAALLGRLCDYHSYLEPTMCDFDPAIRLLARTDKGAYQFDVCFACSDIAIRLPAGHRRLVHMNSAVRRSLLDLSQTHYPTDPVLKKLYRR
jgi:hypothetical protein